MKPHEFKKLRLEFLKTGYIKNPELMRQWFIDNSELSLQEQAYVLGVSDRRQVSKIRAAINMNPVVCVEIEEDILYFRFPGGAGRGIEVEDIEDLENWQTGEWLYKYYVCKRYSAHQISKAVGVSFQEVHEELRKNGIKSRKHFKKDHNHPCRNRKWIKKHYFDEELPIETCAALAGVSRDVMHKWFADLRIVPRDKFETSRTEQWRSQYGSEN